MVMLGTETSLPTLHVFLPPTSLLGLYLSSYVGLVVGDVSFILIIFINVRDVEDLPAVITAARAVVGAHLGGRCLRYGRKGNSSLI